MRVLGADPADPRPHDGPALAIVVLALLASVTSLASGFAYDDRWIIVDNPNVHDLPGWWRVFAETYWPATRNAALYRPFTILVYILQWAAGGGTPLLFHTLNVILYAGVCVLAYFLALRLLPRGAAWVAGALFAVHPVHVEAVGNVVGQAELWSAAAVLGAMVLYLRGREGGLPLDSRTKGWIAALYLGGMMFKENAIVLPALLLAAEAFAVNDPRPWRRRLDELAGTLVWLTLLAAIMLGIRVIVTGTLGGDVEHPALRNLSMVQRSWVMLALAPEFGRLLLWPVHLYADYSPRLVPVLPAPDVGHAGGALLLLCLAALAIVSVRRFPLVSLSLAWIAITMAPVANILLPTGILIAERTLFLPSFGAVVAVASLVPWCVAKLRAQPPAARLVAASPLVFALGWAAAHSAERQREWKDSGTVFRTLARDAFMSFKAHYANGGMLWEEKRPMEAEREWRMAIALMPAYFGVYQEMGHRYREAHVCPAAIPMYQKALALEQALPLSRVGLAACYLEMANYRKARAEARTAIADGMYRRAFQFIIDRADSALVASDSLDGANRWRGSVSPVTPKKRR